MDSLSTDGWEPGTTPGSDGNGPHAVSEAQRRPEVRSQLAARVNGLIRERQLTQTAAAVILGIPQPHISELRHFKLTRFSAERLLHFITLLDRDVEILIRPKDEASAMGTVSVQIAA